MNSQEVYVLRLWHEHSSYELGSHEQGNDEAWRVTITDTKSQEKLHFANLEALFGFFREKLESQQGNPP
jgi:hypothetical protein